jgi:hypothetical protein
MSLRDLISWRNLREGSLLASDAIGAYNKILHAGLLELEIELPNAAVYDHDNPQGNYDDKNQYFNRANNLGISLLRQNATGFSKMYYWHLLNAINEHEKKNKKPLNKGMVCGNLGVSALAEGDIDGGIAYLAWAMHEDRGWIKGKPENSIFVSPLYVQFAEAKGRGGISQFGGSAPWVMLNDSLSKYNKAYGESVDISAIFKELEDSPEHRALFEGSIWTIHRNLSLLREENARGIYKKENNMFTRLRLFDGIVTLCRFAELRMKYHESRLKVLKKKQLKEAMSGTLGTLLKKVFGESWFTTETSTIPRFEASKARQLFNQFLSQKLKGKSSHVRSLLLLLVIRNYSAHICDPEVPPFFKKIERIFDEIIAAYVYYLKFRKII